MPHVHQSEVKARAHKAPLHSRPVRPRTPPSTPPENVPEVPQQQPPHAVEVPQQQAPYAAEVPQHQAPHDDTGTDAADKHQTDTCEAEGLETDTYDPAGAHTPDTTLGPPSGMDPYATLTLPQHQL